MKIVPQFDRYPRLVAFCQTPLGKIALAGAAAPLLAAFGRPDWPAATIAIVAIGCFPQRRQLLLTLAALYWLAFHGIGSAGPFLRATAASSGIASGTPTTLIIGAALVAMLAAAAGLVAYVRKMRDSIVARRPVTVLLAFHFGALAAAAFLPLHGAMRLALWSLLSLLAVYRWSFAYALTDAAAKSGAGLSGQTAAFFPFWLGAERSSTPYPKAAAYLRKVEARTPKEFSVVQLKGLKLLVWAFLLQGMLQAFIQVVHRKLGAPILEEALQHAAAGRLPTAAMAWVAVLTHYVEALGKISVYGHIVIGICRMAGFNALRNTYRPLQAVTLVEFWNRYYYYFKELLVEFFFFPTYLRYFKAHPRLRTFAATFAAAGIGNALYHFDIENVARVGLWREIVGFQVYGFYATVLAIGIGISQARMKRAAARAPATLFHRLRATVGVIAFFCLLDIFDYTATEAYGLTTHMKFVVRLFGF